MKKQYLSIFLFLALIFGPSSLVLADDHSLDTSPENRTTLNGVQTTGASTNFRVTFEERKARLEAQRETTRARAEARRAEAEAKGDEAREKREAERVAFEDKRAEMDAQREAKRVEFEAKRAEMQAKRVEFQQANAQRKVEHTIRVMIATIERLENISNRIESRITKIEARGGATAESAESVVAARVNLADARTAVEAFASIDLTSEEARENYERIRVAAKEARELIRAAHQNLMLAVRSLSSAEVEVEDDSPEEGEE